MSQHRIQFLEILKAYNPSDMERAALHELIEYIETDDACFLRTHIDGAKHIAASVFLVDQDNNILLLWHKKIKQWVQPGGHCDGNDNVMAVALAELEEETGIKLEKVEAEPLEIRKYVYQKDVFGYGKSVYNIMFLAQVDTREQSPRICEPDKCEKMAWFSVDDAIAALSASPYPNPAHAAEKFKRRVREGTVFL